jgi:hypothetical protein
VNLLSAPKMSYLNLKTYFESEIEQRDEIYKRHEIYWRLHVIPKTCTTNMLLLKLAGRATTDEFDRAAQSAPGDNDKVWSDASDMGPGLLVNLQSHMHMHSLLAIAQLAFADSSRSHAACKRTQPAIARSLGSHALAFSRWPSSHAPTQAEDNFVTTTSAGKLWREEITRSATRSAALEDADGLRENQMRTKHVSTTLRVSHAAMHAAQAACTGGEASAAVAAAQQEDAARNRMRLEIICGLRSQAARKRTRLAVACCSRSPERAGGKRKGSDASGSRQTAGGDAGRQRNAGICVASAP